MSETESDNYGRMIIVDRINIDWNVKSTAPRKEHPGGRAHYIVEFDY